MCSIVVLVCSCIFQFLTAGVSLSNIKLTGKKISWLLIAFATILMGIRRVIPLYHVIIGDNYSLDLVNEIIGMIISLTFLIGIVGIRYIFIEWNQNKKEIELLSYEKDILLKEVHHRLKNNMNVIKNLLSLQAAKINIPDATSAFQDGIARIESMGLLYEKLYKSEKYHVVSSREYFSQLIDEIIEIFPDTQNILIKKKLDDFQIDTDKIIPLGLILNELLTNTIKYGFKGQTSCIILIETVLADRQVVFIYEDNGIGMPELADKKTDKGFGLRLIELLVAQIGGTYQVRVEDGTKYIIKFELL